MRGGQGRLVHTDAGHSSDDLTRLKVTGLTGTPEVRQWFEVAFDRDRVDIRPLLYPAG